MSSHALLVGDDDCQSKSFVPRPIDEELRDHGQIEHNTSFFHVCDGSGDDRMKAAIGDCCQAYSLLKKLVSREPCKARSIIRAHSMKDPKERLHATWQEFLLNFDGANVRGFADCMDTLKHATSDRY